MTRPLQRPLRRPLRAPYGPGASMDYAGSASGNSAGMWWAGTDLWLDLANNYGMNNGAPIAGSVVTDTHAQSINAPNTVGLYSSFATNVLTRTDLGLQTVPSRTELNPSTIPTNGVWTKVNIAITDNALTAPDGTLTAGLVARTNTAAAYCTPGGIGKAASPIQYTTSVMAKAGTGDFLPVRIQGTYPACAEVCFNLSLGTISSAASVITFTGASATITAMGSGWYLCTLTATSSTETAFSTFISALTATGTVESTDASATANLYVWYMNCQAAAFAVPPILTGASTVNGNQQIINLTGRLGTGVAGLIQFYPQDIGATGDAALVLSNNTLNERVQLINSSGALRVQTYVGGVSQGSIGILGTYSPALQTVAFAAQAGFMTARRVGQADPGSFAIAAYPTMSQIALGGGGYNTGVNMFQYTKKLALSFGPQDATTFAAMYARAVLASTA